jgi:hypothetical protein
MISPFEGPVKMGFIKEVTLYDGVEAESVSL